MKEDWVDASHVKRGKEKSECEEARGKREWGGTAERVRRGDRKLMRTMMGGG